MKHKFTRESFIPKDAEEFADGNAVAYLSTERGRVVAVGFGGKRQKPDFNYIFKDQQAALLHIFKYLAGQRGHEEAKAERRKARKEFKTTLKVGDILCTSWGYEQTNVNWYQVIEVKSSGKTVVIREIATGKSEDIGWMCGYCWPKKDAFVGEPMTKRVREGNLLSMTSYSSAFPWDGKKKYWSSYH